MFVPAVELGEAQKILTKSVHVLEIPRQHRLRSHGF
jgi:hypothetical protein